MPPISSEDFRDALRHFPAGVTIVTTRHGETVHGMTASAFTSVSPNPPLILVCVDHRHTMHELLSREDASFAVNILGEDQEELSNRFAFTKDVDRFATATWEKAATGSPVLADAVAWLDCRVHNTLAAGTHTIYVGEVLASRVVREGGDPLLYWNQGYRRLAAPEQKG
ncbi:MAG: flavin reductase family protein [Acidobacteriota bacterium]